MPEPTRTLPQQPSLEQQQKLAKDLLKAFQADDDDARDRIRRHLPDKPTISLADAQFTVAREYGFESWAALKTQIEAGASREATTREFRRLVEARDASSLRRLLQQQPSARTLVDAPIFSYGSPALNSVASGADVAVVDVLLEFGADPNRRTDWALGPWHPLHGASQVVADRLIAAGAQVDACAAAHLGRVDELRRILDAQPERVHERGGDGQTPLHFASSREVIDLLLERGADVDARDFDHRASAAEWMIAHWRGAGRYDLAQYLVERGAYADIFLAAALGLVDRIRELVEADRNVLDLRTKQGDYAEKPPSSFHIYTWTIGENLTPLQVAVQFKQDEAAALLSSFASPGQRFIAACALGDEAKARQLLRDTPDLIDRLSPQDKRALADAGWAANAAGVKLMLDLGFDPAVPGGSGGTVLHNSAWEGSVECVEIALRHDNVRALINTRDRVYGGAPLNWCCHGALNCGNPEADHLAVARLLLEAGAQLNDETIQHAPVPLVPVLRAWQAKLRAALE